MRARNEARAVHAPSHRSTAVPPLWRARGAQAATKLHESLARQELLLRRMQYAAAVLQAEFGERFDVWDQVDEAAASEAPALGSRAAAEGGDQPLVHLQRLIALHGAPPPPRAVSRTQV